MVSIGRRCNYKLDRAGSGVKVYFEGISKLLDALNIYSARKSTSLRGIQGYVCSQRPEDSVRIESRETLQVSHILTPFRGLRIYEVLGARGELESCESLKNLDVYEGFRYFGVLCASQISKLS